MKTFAISIFLFCFILPLTTSTFLQADLQSLINATPVGGTLTLADGSNYSCNCVVNKSITITTAGKATIKTPNADPAIYIPPKTAPVVIKNVEITTTSGQVYDIVRYGSTGTDQDSLDEVPQGLTLDGVDIHGQPGQEVQRGIAANGANFVLKNSKVREIHGKGYDTQAVCAWNSPGPFQIVNNYLEAAGENVMFGGATGGLTATGTVQSDIEIRGNRFFKPLSWRGVWTVKNLLEFKSGRRVVVDGNTFENNWLDAQQGYSILFTPRPNDSGPAAVVEDITFSNNIVRHVAAGVHVAGQDSLYTPAPTAKRGRNIRIVNNLFDDVNGPAFGGDGCFLKAGAGIDDLTIEKNTVIQTGSIVKAWGDPGARLVFRNNAARHNEYGFSGDSQGYGNPAINTYFLGAVFTGNVIAKEINGPWNWDTVYPAGNFYPATLSLAIGADFKQIAPYTAGADMVAIYAAQGGSPTPTPSVSPTPQPTVTPTPVPTATPTPLPSPKPPTVREAVWFTWPSRSDQRKAMWIEKGQQGFFCVPYDSVLYCVR